MARKCKKYKNLNESTTSYESWEKTLEKIDVLIDLYKNRMKYNARKCYIHIEEASECDKLKFLVVELAKDLKIPAFVHNDKDYYKKAKKEMADKCFWLSVEKIRLDNQCSIYDAVYTYTEVTKPDEMTSTYLKLNEETLLRNFHRIQKKYEDKANEDIEFFYFDYKKDPNNWMKLNFEKEFEDCEFCHAVTLECYQKMK